MQISTLARMGTFYSVVVVNALVASPYFKIALGALLVSGLLIQHVIIQPATGCGLRANCCRAVMYAWAIWGFAVSALRHAIELDDVWLGALLAGALLISPLTYLTNRLRARKFDKQDVATTILKICSKCHSADPRHVMQNRLENILLKDWLGDAAHDEQNRQSLILGFQVAQSYTALERHAIDAGRKMLSQFDASTARRIPMKRRPTVQSSEIRHDDVRGSCLGKPRFLFVGPRRRKSPLTF
jgi:cytochrome c553